MKTVIRKHRQLIRDAVTFFSAGVVTTTAAFLLSEYLAR